MTKIEALQKTIYNLENDVYRYDWTIVNSCNCGILAQSITNKEPKTYGYYSAYDDETLLEKNGWSPWARKSVCLKTGENLGEVWAALKDTGFTHEDIVGLEKLTDNTIAIKADIIGESFSDKETVVKYLKAWVELLEEEKLNSEQGAQGCDATMAKKVVEVGSIKTVIKYVSVPETINESLPETILS